MEDLTHFTTVFGRVQGQYEIDPPDGLIDGVEESDGTTNEVVVEMKRTTLVRILFKLKKTRKLI